MARSFASLLLLLAALASRADAGHEIPYYPSFYPQEIALTVAEPAAAARLFAKNAIHAYLGPLAAPKGAELAWTESFRAYVVLTFNPASRAFADARERCAVAARLAPALATSKGEYVVYPYPVTPWHEDYAHHADLVEAARARAAMAGAIPRLRVSRSVAGLSPGPAWRPADGEWDATLEEVPLDQLLREEATRLDGWMGPPWFKQGWFHAHALSARAVTEPGARSAVEETYARRVRGDYASATERLNLERRLVSLVTRGCERMPLGYALRREAVSDTYSEGVENVGFDTQWGLASGVFFRTVKLKDFPWNGWLRVATATRPAAAWNPVGGFTDGTGGIMWSILADAAVLPEPYGVGWLPNRVRAVEVSGPVEVPRDALVFEPATGLPRAAAPGTTAQQKVTYRVALSKFHDQTKMTVADLVYPYVLARRWSENDRGVDRATAHLREWLAAVRVVKLDTEVRDFGDLQVILDTPVLEVYLRHAADSAEAPAIAPPWSAVPWQLLVLMEEAVTRGLAAFSEDEARRRGVAWLDLARDRKLVDALGPIAESFERRAYVPEALRGLVTVEQAQQRWAALRRFRRQSGHWLVTSGPYRLQKWSADTTVLAVFRDLSYPNVVGSFDRYALPRRAWIGAIERRGDRLELQVDAQTLTKFERSYKIVREPMRLAPTGEKAHDVVVACWTAIGAGDEVVATGRAQEVEGDRLVVDLKGKLPPGAYRILLGLALNGHSFNPEVKVISYRVAE
ncbi:MAG TPA: hypothetical protein VFD81_05565 [Methylomirabilota bacterium]|nr:hypothetical protein [Methylomirabilota bacterium]